MKLIMPDGREWVHVRAEGVKYYIGRKRYAAVEIGAMVGVTASGLRNRAHRYNIDFATAFNAPRPKDGNTHLQSLEMDRYLTMLKNWPEYPMRKPNGADKPERPIQPMPAQAEPMERLFMPRPKPQEVDVRVTVMGDQDQNMVAMREALEQLVGLTRAILHELQVLNGPPHYDTPPLDTEDHSHDMD